MTDKLRRRAEELARANVATGERVFSSEEARQVLHELRVHQIELEMQNEELRRAQLELEAVRARYYDLYNLAPVGYVTLSDQGLVLQANDTSGALLGVARGMLVGQALSRFIFKEDQDRYYLYRKQLFATNDPQACELRMVKNDETIFWTRLEAVIARDADGAAVCHVVMSDIAERKQAEYELTKAQGYITNILDSMPSVLVGVDPQGVVTHWNKAAEVAVGIPARRPRGVPWNRSTPGWSPTWTTSGRPCGSSNPNVSPARRFLKTTSGAIRT